MKLDFKGKTIFVGMDVHDNSWELQIMTQHAVQKQIHLRPANVETLMKLLNQHYPGADYVVAYEAGYCGFWIQHELSSRGVKCLVVSPADIPSTPKDKEKKTDKYDCRKIARYLQSGLLEGIYIPSEQDLLARSIVRHRYKCQQDQKKQKNRVRSHLKFYGYKISWEEGVDSRYWSKRMVENIKSFAKTKQDIALELELQKLNALRKLEYEALKKIRELSRTDKYKDQVSYLTSISGIGVLTAMLLITELVRIDRFKNLDHLASYVGLVPSIRSSGEKEKHLGLVKRCNLQLRNNIIQSAWSSIRYNPEMALYYEECRERMIAQKAIIKVAKKILNRVRYVMLNEKKLAA